ncbi:MAG: hypothetical protein L6R37_006901 [Teloschistes peruensis]|nr:MAG: hypothetical protein L6R37_006901 [Teloschistes peruensis]
MPPTHSLITKTQPLNLSIPSDPPTHGLANPLPQTATTTAKMPLKHPNHPDPPVPTPIPTPLPFPLRFYSPTSPTPDDRGRTLSTILCWPPSRLESSHDYIQNLFPLPERSPYNPSAPLIDEYTFYTFRTSEELQSQLRRSLACMARFYGFDYVVRGGDGIAEVMITFEPQPQPDFEAATRNWLTTPFSHNHLRITRIIRCCRLLGLEAEAEAFHDAITKAAQHPQFARSRMYWRRAAERPLYLAPEDEEDEEDEEKWTGFLYRFEEARDECRSGVESEGEDGDG